MYTDKVKGLKREKEIEKQKERYYNTCFFFFSCCASLFFGEFPMTKPPRLNRWHKKKKNSIRLFFFFLYHFLFARSQYSTTIEQVRAMLYTRGPVNTFLIYYTIARENVCVSVCVECVPSAGIHRYTRAYGYAGSTRNKIYAPYYYDETCHYYTSQGQEEHTERIPRVRCLVVH